MQAQSLRTLIERAETKEGYIGEFGVSVVLRSALHILGSASLNRWDGRYLIRLGTGSRSSGFGRTRHRGAGEVGWEEALRRRREYREGGGCEAVLYSICNP